MKTQVTFQFDTPEEAIAWLAKAFLEDDKKPKASVAPARTDKAATATPPVAAGTKRGPGRPPKKAAAPTTADAGVSAHGTTERIAPPPTTPDPSVAPAPTTPAPVQNPPIEEVSTSVQTLAAGVPDAAGIVALQAVLKEKGMPAAQAILKHFGVKRWAEVKPEARAAFIAYCDKVAAGEIDPTKAS